MGKFIITEEDRKSIRSLYGLNEQTITLPIPISDTFETKNGDLDAVHNLKGLERKIDRALEQIYNQGINPKMYDVKLKVVRNGNTYTTTSSLTIDKSDDGKAWTGFASRGSIGYGYVNRADGQIDGSGNADGRSLEEKLKSGADAVEFLPISNSPITISNVELKQYFVQFTKSLKPSHTSSKSTSQPKTQPSQPKTQQNAPETESIDGNSLIEFRKNLKSKTANILIDENSVKFSYSNNMFKVSYSTGETEISGMTLVFDPSETELDSRITTTSEIPKLYPNLIRKEEWKGKSEGFYYEFLILKK
jgi:hypothetical protein